VVALLSRIVGEQETQMPHTKNREQGAAPPKRTTKRNSPLPAVDALVHVRHRPDGDRTPKLRRRAA
jgi:hypothetical protein